MAKKQQSTQQPSRKPGTEKNERLWDTPARPITPTPANTPAQPPAQPAPETVQPPAQPPAQPAPKPQSSTEKK